MFTVVFPLLIVVKNDGMKDIALNFFMSLRPSDNIFVLKI